MKKREEALNAMVTEATTRAAPGSAPAVKRIDLRESAVLTPAA